MNGQGTSDVAEACRSILLPPIRPHNTPTPSVLSAWRYKRNGEENRVVFSYAWLYSSTGKSLRKKAGEQDVEKDVKTSNQEQAQRANEAVHELLVRLKHAADEKSVADLFTELYARCRGMFENLIRRKYRGWGLYHDYFMLDVDDIIQDAFLRIFPQIGNYEESSCLGISWTKNICDHVTNKQLLQRIREKTKHANVNYTIPNVYKEPLEVDASPYIAEAERFLREVRLLQLEKSQTIDVKSSSNSTVESGEKPAPTEVDTMGGVEEQPIPQQETQTVVLHSTEVIPEITISDDESGIFIEYASSSQTKAAVEQVVRWLEAQGVATDSYLFGFEGKRSAALLLPHKQPLKPGWRVFSPKAGGLFLPEKHFAPDHPKELSRKQVKLAEASAFVIEQLEKIDFSGVQSTLLVKETQGVPFEPVVEEAKKQESPLMGLHRALKETKVDGVSIYDKLKLKNRRVLEAYLTTDKPMGDLRNLAQVQTADAVNHIVHRNLHKVFEYLPPEERAKYGGSAKEAIKRKASEQLKTRLVKERVTKGLVTKRWQHYREVDKPQGKSAFSEQGLENIRRARSNTPREDLSKAAHRRWEKHREQQSQSTTTQEPPQASTPKEYTVVDLTNSSQKR